MKIPKNKTLVLSSNDIQSILQYHGLNKVMDDLTLRLINDIRSFDAEKTVIPIRSGFHYDKPQSGLIEWMPLLNKGEQVLIKVVGYHPSNPDINGYPTIVSTISAYDTASGHMTGIMDGVLLTALRTGAASAVASKYMAHPESTILGMIGCGAQAITQLHALSRMFKLKKVLIYDADPNAMLSFAGRCSILDLHLKIIPSNLIEIVESAQILCTATSIEVGAGPLFENIQTQPGLHVNAIGSDFPGKVELPLDLLQDSLVCPDFLEQALAEGECQQLERENIGPCLVEVVQNPDQYPEIQNQRSIFDSTGWALEDQVVMELFMDYASGLGLGQEIEIENLSGDAKNPYHFMVKAVEKSQAANRF